MLNADDLERFRQRLLEDRASLEERVRTRTDQLGGGEGEVAGDEARTIADRQQALDDNELERDLLGRIDKALSRIAAGTYGISEVSGKPIPKDRLDALPTATTLVDEQPPG